VRLAVSQEHCDQKPAVGLDVYDTAPSRGFEVPGKADGRTTSGAVQACHDAEEVPFSRQVAFALPGSGFRGCGSACGS
jgi:hypothetical protein